MSGFAGIEQTDLSSSDTESEASNGSHTFILDDEVSEIMYNIFGKCELLEEEHIIRPTLHSTFMVVFMHLTLKIVVKTQRIICDYNETKSKLENN